MAAFWPLGTYFWKLSEFGFFLRWSEFTWEKKLHVNLALQVYFGSSEEIGA
jgi:hypothetical protein